MRPEYSERWLFLGKALRPANKASPSAAIQAITWLFRSMDQSLSAKQHRKACWAGIILEPGKPAAWASFSTSKRTRSATNRNSPPPVGGEGARAQGELPDIGHRFHRGAGLLGAFVIAPPRQRSEPLGFEDFPHAGRTQGAVALLERLANLINGMVLR